MMRAMEMWIITVWLTATALALPQTCLQYCKLSPEHSSIPLPECNCSLLNPRKIRSTPMSEQLHNATPSKFEEPEISNEPAKSAQDDSVGEPLSHSLSLMSSLNSNNNTSSHESPLFREQDRSEENIAKFSNEEEFFQKIIEETKGLPLYLYLDLDTSQDFNQSQLEELKHMFVNFQTAEKNLNECINLHIYIFSKYTDTINQITTNRDQKVEPDNLSSFQELTEIQNKCEQTDSIIKQSIYQIKRLFPTEESSAETAAEAEYPQTEQGPVDINDNVLYNGTYESGIHASITTKADMYTSLSSEDGSSVPLNTVKANDVQYLNTNTKLVDFSSISHLQTTEYKNDVATAVPSTAKSSDYNDIGTTSTAVTDPITISDEDIQLPSIITKELSNGTLISVIDGYEKIPNSDFTTNSNNSTVTNTSSDNIVSPNINNLNQSMSNSDSLKDSIDKIIPSDLIEIRGNLYFLFGRNQIPARFIQQPGGELNLAIDGFSMCGQILEENPSQFMNSLCKCILLHHCT